MHRLFLLLFAVSAFAQNRPLQGVIDIHVHSDPDSMARKIDALEMARLARDEGMRAIVLKNHYAPTAQLAYVVGKTTPGIEVFGAIALNRSLGGLNPEAIEHAANTHGGNLKIVWMPTWDAQNDVTFRKLSTPFVPISKNGALLPETLEVIKTIAKHKLVLATGHSSPQEDLMLVREAKRLGVEKIVVTHPLLNVVSMTIPQMQEAVKMGAYVEFCVNQVLPTVSAETRIDPKDYVKAMRAVGVEHAIVSGDLGQPQHPVHTEGWKQFFEILKKSGMTDAEIDTMARKNPAALLGIK
jgi:Family of unknown function (DUF6282)